MALKSYHKETLNDNWYEERATPLRGVLPYDGAPQYATTTQSDHAGAQPVQPRRQLRMIHGGNVDQALLQTAKLSPHNFRAGLPAPDFNQEKRYLESTHRSTFTNPFPARAPSFGLMDIPAGGSGGQRVERGKAASGVMGEVFRVHPDPQRDTHAQRSWLYSTDPMIKVMQERQRSGNNQDEAPGSHSTDNGAPKDFRRMTTSITAIPRNHQGVYVDD